MQLSRAGEENDVEASITVVGISNDLKYGDRLDTRVESSFAPDEIVFPAYDANQLGDILNRRRDAYHDGVLSDDVIPLCSAFSAQEHGDARRAIDLFRLAGEIARDDDADHVREEHVRAANDDAEVTRIQDLIRGCPTQAKVAIAALAAMDEYTNQSHFKATEMYQVYREFAEAIDTNVLGQKRITDQLREYETLKIIDMTRTSDGYRGERTFSSHCWMRRVSCFNRSASMIDAQRFLLIPECANGSSILSAAESGRSVSLLIGPFDHWRYLLDYLESLAVQSPLNQHNRLFLHLLVNNTPHFQRTALVTSEFATKRTTRSGHRSPSQRTALLGTRRCLGWDSNCLGQVDDVIDVNPGFEPENAVGCPSELLTRTIQSFRDGQHEIVSLHLSNLR